LKLNNSESDLSVKIGKLFLKNPVIMCSGTFASGIEFNEFYDVSMLGAVVTKSFSLEPREGNKPPRLCETASGLINSIGLQNEGIDFFIKNQLKTAVKLKVNIILSILGNDSGQFKDLALKIKKIEDEIIAVELNVSCPNIKKGGITLAESPDELEKSVKAVTDIVNVPVIVKLSPNLSNLSDLALRAKNSGAQIISLVNTFSAIAIDIDSFKSKLGNKTGGLSGPAIKPIALLKVHNLYKEKILPIIGMGGIFCWQDAVEFLIAGASAIGLGTVNFVDPFAGPVIIKGISNYLNEKKIKKVADLTGILKD